jgi:hypothetical protein
VSIVDWMKAEIVARFPSEAEIVLFPTAFRPVLTPGRRGPNPVSYREHFSGGRPAEAQGVPATPSSADAFTPARLHGVQGNWNCYARRHYESSDRFRLNLVYGRPPLWSSGQSSWLQIRRPGFDSRHYQKKNVVVLERGPLSLVSTTEELLDRNVAAPV